MRAFIAQAFEEEGWFESDGQLNRNPKADRRWYDLLPEDAVPLKAPISDVLYEAYAEHAPSSDWNAEVFDFVDEHL